MYQLIHVHWLLLSRSVMSNSLWPCGLQPTRLLCPWGFSRQEYWSCHTLLQGIFPMQGSNPCLLCLLHCRWVLYHWPHLGNLDGQTAPRSGQKFQSRWAVSHQGGEATPELSSGGTEGSELLGRAAWFREWSPSSGDRASFQFILVSSIVDCGFKLNLTAIS